jgi:aspartate carbamoyltransferase catalytic subunit
MPLSITNLVRGADKDYAETYNVQDVIGDADVLYVTRVQKERFSDLEQYEELKHFYIVDETLMHQAKEKMVVMHPLPRVGEITYSVDSDPRAAYFRQVRNGLYIRMALLAAALAER